jgi:hypothetical protein
MVLEIKGAPSKRKRNVDERHLLPAIGCGPGPKETKPVGGELGFGTMAERSKGVGFMKRVPQNRR